MILRYFQQKYSDFHEKMAGMKRTNAPAAQLEDNSAENNIPVNGAGWTAL